MEIEASLIIPSHRNDDRLCLVLLALRPQLNPLVEVIVVLDDYRCSSERIEILLVGHRFRIIDPHKSLGAAQARNMGINQAAGAVLIFLDDDRIPGRDFVEQHLRLHRVQTCVVVGERRNVFFEEQERASLFQSFRYSTILKRSRRENAELIRRVFFVSSRCPWRWMGFITGNASVRRMDVLSAGGFDSSFQGWGYEDTELGFRLARLGVPFLKVASILNYHLEHPHRSETIQKEEAANYQRFRAKIPKFSFDRLLLNLLHWRFRILFTVKKTY